MKIWGEGDGEGVGGLRAGRGTVVYGSGTHYKSFQLSSLMNNILWEEKQRGRRESGAERAYEAEARTRVLGRVRWVHTEFTCLPSAPQACPGAPLRRASVSEGVQSGLNFGDGGGVTAFPLAQEHPRSTHNPHHHHLPPPPTHTPAGLDRRGTPGPHSFPNINCALKSFSCPREGIFWDWGPPPRTPFSSRVAMAEAGGREGVGVVGGSHFRQTLPRGGP